MPELIYRYRKFEKYSIEELINSEFYCSLPNEVNDPFDSKCIFDDRGTEDDFRKHYNQCLTKQQPDLSEIERQDKVDAFIKSNWWQLPENREILFKDFRNNIISTFSDFGMVCFNKLKDNILMWSHYAEGHRGFCLEFDRTILNRECQAPLDDIKYKLRTFSDLMVGDEINVAKKLLLSKAEDWTYENEVRMIVPLKQAQNVLGLKDGSFMKYPTEALTGVIFGCLMPEKDRDTLKKILTSESRNKPIFYEAVKSNNAFKLTVKPVANAISLK